MEYITLNTGVKIPLIGTGTNTFGKLDRRYDAEITGDTSELEAAIAAGYRLIDTAISYRNESVIGEAVKKSGLARSEFFLTSKIPGRVEYTASREAVEEAIAYSLAQLQTDYIDLYLIHHPWDNLDEIVSVWKVLEEYVDKGVLRAIGVSNFDQTQLQYLLDNARIEPAVNQVQSNAGDWNHEVITFGKKHGIVTEAWGPLSGVSDEARAKLSEIGEGYRKSWAQVSLRYQTQEGIVVIPKSHDSQRQRDNLTIFDFQLTEAEMREIAAL